MLKKRPYFLKSKEWYVEHKGIPKFLGGNVERLYTLTSKAPQKAIDSYNKYYNDDETQNTIKEVLKKDAK